MDNAVKGRIGDQLIEKGLITQAQLEVALSEQRRVWRPLGEILVSLGFVGEADIAELIAGNLGLPFVRAREIEPDPLLLSTVTRDFVRESGAFPISLVEGTLRVAMVSPDAPEKVGMLRVQLPYHLELAVTTEADLLKLIKEHMPEQEARVKGIFEGLGPEEVRTSEDIPVEELTHAILLDGVHRGATDVHIEPDELVTRVRYRIDGILTQGENLPKAATEAIISRVKVLSNLDISERRRPQDGRMRIFVDEHPIDLRVSLMPCIQGENVVLRILDTSGGALNLKQLGMSEQNQRRLMRIGSRPHGLFLVTGPTGSGKTTTLYAMLATINAMERNVATVEDPVEYRLPLLRQSQMEPAIGYSFNEGLRALLRQDPDVILVGEIRDQETAEMAIKASMTGHLVFSTLHTNSAIGAVPRLKDLGIDPFLIEDALIGVLAQRLVRKNCERCSQPVEATPEQIQWMDGDVGDMRQGRGCVQCNGKGMSGRAAICELFLPNEAMAEELKKGSDLHRLMKIAVENGFELMTVDGKRRIREGMTTIEEVLRVNRSHRLEADER